MSAQHTPGPLSAHHDHGWLVIESSNGDLYLKVEKGSSAKKHMANARRLVACWNACEGISTEHLERHGLPDFAQKISDLAALREALEAAPQPARQLLDAAEIAAILREACRTAATRRDGTTTTRIVRAVERAHGITGTES